MVHAGTPGGVPLNNEVMDTQFDQRLRKATRGFTLIELLVTLAIIAILAGLSLGGLATARFRSRVTVCANNFRQWGIVINLYATEDSKGRLPSFELDLRSLPGLRNLSPHMVATAMITNLNAYGATLPLWFCPARSDLAQASKTAKDRMPGRSLNTTTDLHDYYVLVNRHFAGTSLCWYIPRPLVGSDIVFPDPTTMKCRSSLGWPRRLDDLDLSSQPMITDRVAGVWNEPRTALEVHGGHEFPPQFSRGINLVFLDGHVETRAKRILQWQIDPETASGYVFVY